MTEDFGPTEAGWLSDDARLIALVREVGADGWAAGVAVGLADMVGRDRGRTFLANVASEPAPLDRLLGAGSGPGLTSALTGAATVAAVALREPSQHFAYLPSGEAALPYAGLRRMPTFRQFLHKVREGGGTVLLYLGEEDIGREADRDPAVDVSLDGCIALGSVRGVATELGAPLLARVERPLEPEDARPPGSEAGEPSGETAYSTARLASAEAAPARTDRAARDAAELEGGAAGFAAEEGLPSGLPGSLSRVWIPVVGLLVLWAVWALFAREPGPQAEAAEGEAGAAVVSGAEGAGDVGAVAPDRDPAVPRREFQAPPATYSILVGSYIRLRDAMQRRDELASDGGLFLVTPTPVQGRVYQRVLAGVFEDRTQATAAMERLVADGRKEIVKEWDIRPVRLAYDLGTFAALDSARGAAERYSADGIPAYVLRDTAATPLYRVYAGAFEREASAEALRQLLEARGSAAKLNVRTGIAP